MLGDALRLAAAGTVELSGWGNVENMSHVRFDKCNSNGNVNGIFFSPDGTKLFTIDGSNDRIEATHLSTAWDISTHGSLVRSLTTNSTYNPDPQSLFISPDGTKLFTCNLSSGTFNQIDAVVRYNLPNAWSLQGATYNSRKLLSQTDTSSQLPVSVFFKPDGLSMFVYDQAPDRMYRYTAGTAWDLSSFGNQTKTNSLISTSTGFSGQFWHPDGVRCYLVGTSLATMYQYNTSSAWGLGGISHNAHDSTFSVSSQESAPVCLYISPNGRHVYIGGRTGQGIDQYSLDATGAP